MKFIRLLGNFYRRNIIGSAILFCIITFSLFLMTYVTGIIRYITFSRDVFVDSGLNGSYYFMSTVQASSENYDTEINALLEKIKESDGVEQVLSQTGAALNHEKYYAVSSTAISPDFAARYRPVMESGQWLSDECEVPPGAFPAVIAGPSLSGVHVGDSIEFSVAKWQTDENGNYTGSTSSHVTFYIVGSLGDFGYIPNLGISGGGISTDAFLQPANGLIFLDTPETQDVVIRDNPGNFTFPNFFILLEEGLSPEQKDACLNRLKAYGQVATTEEILENTNASIYSQMAVSLPYPLFAIIVSTFCFFSLSILFVQKKLDETSVYSLCGCSKKKNFAIAAAGLGLIGALACCVAAVAMARYYKDYKSLALVNMQNYNIYVDTNSYLYLLAYLALILAISLTVPFLARRKMSLIELYRRKTQ